MKERFTARRIIVLGCPGSGKSTFSLKLHDKTGIPLIHLDQIFWNADKSYISNDDFDQKLSKILKEPCFIIDGDYSRTYEERIASCDTVIFLDYDKKDCIQGIVSRLGKVRVDMPWTEEALDPELMEIVDAYGEKNRPLLYDLFEKYPDKQVIIFHSREEADVWLTSLA